MSDLSEKYAIRFLMDNIYELVDIRTGEVVETGSYKDLVAYIQLEEMGLL